MSVPLVVAPIQQTDSYPELVRRVHDLIQSCVPQGATVAVVSRGDSELLRIAGRDAWHFPRTQTGVYAGHHPADDADAIARLEQTRAAGANFLVLPATAQWWLDHYSGFKRHLEARYRRVADANGTATVFSLEAIAPGPEPRQDHAHEALIQGVRMVAAALLPASARVLVATRGDGRLLDLGGPAAWHFPQREGGGYAGDDPADSAQAVADLELLRSAGADYLLIPRTAYWWLERYADFRAHLGQAYSLVTRQENVCTIYDLREAAIKHPKAPRRSGLRRGRINRRKDG